MNAPERGKLFDSVSQAPSQISRTSDMSDRTAAKRADVPRGHLFRFRDESERLDFHVEMVCVEIRANLWQMTEQLKVLEAFLERR